MKKLVVKIKSISLLILTLIILVACNHTPEEPNKEDPVNYINGISQITTNPTAYEKVEFQIFDNENYKELNLNPYDYREFKIQGRFISPSNKSYTVLAFWFQDYEIVVNQNWTQNPSGIHGTPSTNPEEPQGLEMVNYIGEPHFRLRFLPEEAGDYQLQIEVIKDGVIVQSSSSDFTVETSNYNYKGVIKVEEKNNRNFVFENGETFIPVGQNNAWYTSSTRKTEDFKVWFSKMQENEANFTRIWFATWSFSLHWGNDFDDFTTRQNAAARLDETIEIAREFDIYYMLTLLNHGQFSAIVNAEWANNPWNSANGGILDFPSQFFMSSKAKEIYKQQILYIIARYGYSSHLMSWELFNEVDWTDQFNATGVHLWHKEMAEFLRENDPYERLITTSYKGQTGSAYQLNTIEFVNPHDYDYNNKNITTDLVKTIDNLFNSYKKPVLHSELGINWESGTSTGNVDPTGVSLKQSQWVGIMGGSAGAAMNWWWDSWVHPNDLYYRFKGAGIFAQNMDMVSDRYQLLHKLPGISITNNNVNILGYVLDDRIYGYLFDKSWNYKSPETTMKDMSVSIPFENGEYILEIFNTDTGVITKTINLNIINNKAEFNLSFTEDSAFIIRKEA